MAVPPNKLSSRVSSPPAKPMCPENTNIAKTPSPKNQQLNLYSRKSPNSGRFNAKLGAFSSPGQQMGIMNIRLRTLAVEMQLCT